MKQSRRDFLATGAAALGGLVTPGQSSKATDSAMEPTAYGRRSRFETSRRLSGLTPLQDLDGIITPSGLHYVVGTALPVIDPSQHRLLLHGLVSKPLVFTMEDLRRFPSVSRIHFLECAGNGGGQGEPTVQKSHGLLSCSEWTGVPLRMLLQEAGVQPNASWIVAEGNDADRHSRAIPLEKALDDALVAYGQNGEAIRPEQGYPVRLLVPGWEGNVNIRWLGRIQVVDRPYLSRADIKYVDLLPDGKARQFAFVMEANSVVTRPSGGQKLSGPGFRPITGLAWSGRGRITRVEVSTDGGKRWQNAALNEPVLSKAWTRFSLPWTWDGNATTIQSRCTDETGYVQPTREELIAVRSPYGGGLHKRPITSWHVQKDGRVTSA